MALAHNLGFPRIGKQRELKFALEAYWQGKSSQAELEQTASNLRAAHWQVQQSLDLLPVGDFAFYDPMLSTTLLLGALPKRFAALAQSGSPLDLQFAMARGTAAHHAMEMTKWFDTNYHYLVPELSPDTTFTLDASAWLAQWQETKAQGIVAKGVLIGPLTWLYLGKEKTAGFDRLSLLPALLTTYQQLLQTLSDHGVNWLQIDEPILTLELPEAWLSAFQNAYATLNATARINSPKLLLATYFDDVSAHADWLKPLPVAGLHIDLCRAPEQLSAFLDQYPADKVLSLGVVDGRNIWRNNLSATLDLLTAAHAQLGERLWIAPSCSLAHCPVDLAQEHKLDAELKSWLAFATQKVTEVALLVKGLNLGRAAIADELSESDRAVQARQTSERIHQPLVQNKLSQLTGQSTRRNLPFQQRQPLQRQRFALPAFPTTTIGSFPQTSTIRQTRAAYKRGELKHLEYLNAMRAEIALAVRKQEEIGLDVLVHGEAERNDMVEYFGEQLRGYAFTELGWVQSYGSRCVKPPIIYGDVFRPEAMTVEWTRYAQSLTQLPMKGMLTGPVTILQWSFVRDDQPRATTALQIALAIRDEVQDLEASGIGMIQIDEPAFREGLPLKQSQWQSYLDWAVAAFQVCCSKVADNTQIHTHMCYSEFNDILPAIAAMDADVITIETSRSDMELLRGFGDFAYPNEIGPGVYDIHSPRVPASAEMLRLMHKACEVIAPENLWINPDCGLKTRNWPETEAALHNMVAVAHTLRQELSKQQAKHPANQAA
ncbi:5-methyltetrahydropteroyltriglutamate--homocysteine S-methyltransferase [Ampullimonas aquatilis]|uniref:5-methyltetrahydropteroyltriglutamate-- homocysteine S-methyltransferase n=1 Tax=Ampullimonas aquatilis TaxID=1341549 RepID=UPI003C70935F